MRIAMKMGLGTLVPVALIWCVGIYSLNVGRDSLRLDIERSSADRASDVLDELDRLLFQRTVEWQSYARHPLLQRTLRASNNEMDGLDDVREHVDRIDRAWRGEEGDAPLALLEQLRSNELSVELRSRLDDLSQEYGHSVFGEVFVTNRHGVNVAQTSRTSDYRQDDEEWWQEAREHSLFVGDVEYDSSAEIYSCDICVRVDDDAGRFAGVIKAVFDVAEVIDLLHERASSRDAGGTVTYTLLTADLRVICGTNYSGIPLERRSELIAGIDVGERGEVVIAQRATHDGARETLSALARSHGLGSVRGLGWLLLAERDARLAFAPLDDLQSQVVWAAALASVLSILLTGGIATGFARRLIAMTAMVQTMRDGEAGTRVDARGGDELAQLGFCFNGMAAAIEQAALELEDRAASLEDRNRELAREVQIRRDAETELVDARKRAEEATRLKSEFLANMSHELRTPLNGVIGTTELALDTELTPPQRELLETCKTSADLLLSVINDILDFSKIEAGKLDLIVEPFDLRKALGATLRTVAHVAERKGLELTLDVAPAVPDYVSGDCGRFRQVVMNLVGNALKFTASGEVGVRVTPESMTSEGVTLHVQIVDTGIGIPEEKQDLIFRAFAQADGTITREHGGTGLGLSISRQLVGLMQGRIWLESSAGEGSNFQFTARFGVAAAPVTAVSRGELTGVRVLVVDDNATNRVVLDGLLAGFGMRPLCVAGGIQGLDELDRAERDEEEYELVLLDAMMPELDGFGVAAEIQRRDFRSRPVVMMLSSACLTSDVLRCEQVGISAYLTKPVLRAPLREALMRALGVARQNAAAPAVIAPRTVPTASRVLVAEDNLVNQLVARRFLESAGYEVEVVSDGRQAVEAVIDGRFEIVFMDVQMPELDGLKATAEIRRRESRGARRTHIIAMTAHALAGDKERCIAAGMDSYVSKPVRRAELLHAIEAVVRSGTAPVGDR